MLSVLHYMEMILDDRYLLRRYINCPDDKLSKGGVEIRKNYRRLVSLRDEFESVRKVPPKACYRRVTGYSRAGALPKRSVSLKGHLTIAFADASFPRAAISVPVCVSRTFLKENIMAENEIPEPPDWSDARTFFLEPDLWHEPYELDASESHHLTRVLRIREGEEVRVLDGRGREGRFRVLPYRKNAKAVALRLLDEWMYPEPESKVILAAGWTKAARRGWILEKAVEFEASGIWLWQAERSQFPVPSDIKESWQGQLAAGAKQCRNPWLPELRTMPGGVDELIALAEELGCEHRHVLVESGHKSVMSLTPDTLGQPGRTLCVVGPEGGFTAQEVEKLTRAGFLPATLGERVLRWETAAVLCLGLHWWKRQLGGK